MKRSKQQLKALVVLNLDLFRPEMNVNPAPATLYTKIREHAESQSKSHTALQVSIDVQPGAELPTVEELNQLFERYNWMYFGGKLPRTKITYSNRMISAGAYIPSQRLIRIGRKYHEIFPEDLPDTLKHEMIHILHFNHNADFKVEAKRIGASLRARSHPSLRKPPRYVYVCPKCRGEYPRQKILRMASCGKCSSGRRYDRRFKLRLKWSQRQSNR